MSTEKRRRLFGRSLFVAPAAVVSAGLLIGASALTERQPAAPRDLSEALKPIMQRHNLPSLSVMAVQGGETAALGAAGVRRAGKDEPITMDDRWHIGSCAKSMTATLAARLVESGTIRWETTIGQSLGSNAGLEGRILPEYHGVTLRQLLAHRSGLPEDRAPDPSIWPRIVALNGSMIDQRREAAAIVLSREPATKPGSEMAYSNFGYVVAAAMLEQASAQSWEQLITAHVFEPLGITTFGFGPPCAKAGGDEPADQPRGHRSARARWHPVEPGLLGSDNPPTLRPAGGVHLSLQDWARYAGAHVAGARGDETGFLNAESWKILHADQSAQGYALGWSVGQRDWAGGTVLSHNGSNGLWMAVVWLAPQKDLAIMAVTNAGGGAAARACDEAVVEALRALDLLAPEP